MSRAHKRRNRPGGGGSGKAQPGKLQADHTLTGVLFKIMALPAGSVHIIDDRYLAVSPDALGLLEQLHDRLTELGGHGLEHVDNALRMLQQGGRV